MIDVTQLIGDVKRLDAKMRAAHETLLRAPIGTPRQQENLLSLLCRAENEMCSAAPALAEAYEKLRAEKETLTTALREWKCEFCDGVGSYIPDGRGMPMPADAVRCEKCRGGKLNTIAAAALREIGVHGGAYPT